MQVQRGQSVSAVLSPTALSPILGRHVTHPDFGTGIVTFIDQDGPEPVFGVTLCAHPTMYGTKGVLASWGFVELEGRSELPVFPCWVNGEGLEGLGSCEHAARRLIQAAEAGLGRAA